LSGMKYFFLYFVIFVATPISAQSEIINENARVNSGAKVEKEEQNKSASSDISSLSQSADSKSQLEDLFSLLVITATKKLQKLTEAPAIISIITAKQIKARGYQTVGEALESVAGLDLIHDHTLFNLGIRGINGGMRASSRVVKVMIDGQPVAFRPSLEHFLGKELIPIAVIQRIEVMRGPGSALYGANAFLGLINIITKNAKEIERDELVGTLGYGKSLRLGGTNLLVSAKLNKWKMIVAGTFSIPNESGYQLYSVPGRTHARSDESSQSGKAFPQSYFSKIQYDDKDFGTFALDFNLQRLDSQAEFQDWGVLTHNNRISIYNFYLRSKYNQTFWGRFDWNVAAAYSRGEPTKRDHLDYNSDSDEWVKRKVGYNSLDLSTQGVFNIDEKSSLSIGLDYAYTDNDLLRYSRVNSETDEEFINPGFQGDLDKKQFANVGTFFQAVLYPFYLFNFDVALGLTTGIRYDNHNILGNSLNYRGGAVYQFTDWLYAKMLFGTSYRVPSANQLYSNYITAGGVVSNPELKPERSKTFEFAIGGRVSKYLNFSLDVFYNTIEDKIEIDFAPIGSAGNNKPQNSETIESFGGEAELSFAVQDLSGYTNYSLQKSELTKENPDEIDVFVTVPTSLYPVHMFKFGANYSCLPLYLSFNVEGKYLGGRIASQFNNFYYSSTDYLTERYSLDSYFLLDASISTLGLTPFGKNETSLSVKAYNLFDTRYAFPGSKGFDIPGFGRTIYITLKQEFSTFRK